MHRPSIYHWTRYCSYTMLYARALFAGVRVLGRIYSFASSGLCCCFERLGNVCNVGRLLKNKKCGSAKNKTLSGRLEWSAVIPSCLSFLSLYVVLSIFMSLYLFLGLLVTVAAKNWWAFTIFTSSLYTILSSSYSMISIISPTCFWAAVMLSCFYSVLSLPLLLLLRSIISFITFSFLSDMNWSYKL